MHGEKKASRKAAKAAKSEERPIAGMLAPFTFLARFSSIWSRRPGESAKLWSAAACCRFCQASLLAGRRRTLSMRRASSPTESGSKLPHSRASH